MRFFTRTLACVAMMGAVYMSGCSTAPKSEGDAAKLSADSDATLVGYKAKDTSLQPLLDKSVAYAVFPNIGKAGWIIGGSYGRGQVYEGGKLTGYADISEVSGGFQWGRRTSARY